MTKRKTVEIKITPSKTPTDPPTVDPDHPRIERNEQVKWSCTTGCDFTVVFTEETRKPFKRRVFNNSHRKSGTPKGPRGKYKYSVIVGEGSADPQIIIH